MSETHSKWIPLYVADYLKDTQHLSTAEHGAYMLLIFHAWTRDGVLPADSERLRRITGMQPREWKAAWPVLREFFAEGPDGFRHGRIDRELANAKRNVEQRSAAGKASAEARKRQRDGNDRSTGVATDEQREGQRNGRPSPSPSPLPSPEEGFHQEETKEITSLLAFAGKVVRLNARDFRTWEERFHAIADIRAELGALDDWLQAQDEAKRKGWFHVVSGALNKKHQAALREARTLEAAHSGIPI